jgi:hypothetical protein
LVFFTAKLVCSAAKPPTAFSTTPRTFPRLLEIGRDIDKVIIWGVNAKLTDRIFELEDEICQCLA